MVPNPDADDIAVEYLYSDYKDFDGIKYPSKVVIHFAHGEHTIKLSEFKSSSKLDDTFFNKP
jgi:hypothetical protein